MSVYLSTGSVCLRVWRCLKVCAVIFVSGLPFWAFPSATFSFSVFILSVNCRFSSSFVCDRDFQFFDFLWISEFHFWAFTFVSGLLFCTFSSVTVRFPYLFLSKKWTSFCVYWSVWRFQCCVFLCTGRDFRFCRLIFGGKFYWAFLVYICLCSMSVVYLRHWRSFLRVNLSMYIEFAPHFHNICASMWVKSGWIGRGFIKFLCRRLVGFFSQAFLVFLMKESNKRRQKQPGKLMAKSRSQPVNLPGVRPLINETPASYIPLIEKGTPFKYLL